MRVVMTNDLHSENCPSFQVPGAIIAYAGGFSARGTCYAGRYWEDDLVDRGYSHKAGFLRSSEAPGLGIDGDKKRVAKYADGRTRISRP
jgi:hypothetical protein